MTVREEQHAGRRERGKGVALKREKICNVRRGDRG